MSQQPPFGQTVLLWRHARGLTQEALAAQARLSRPNLCMIERGQREVSLTTLRALAAALAVTPGTLVDGIPPAGSDVVPSLSRARLERIAQATLTGERCSNPSEQTLAEALQAILGNRLAALGAPGWRGAGRRRTQAAWLWLTTRYPSEVVQSLIQRVIDRVGRRG